MKNKIFDCVEMKRESQEHIYNEIKNMNREEELKYWINVKSKMQEIIDSKHIQKMAIK